MLLLNPARLAELAVGMAGINALYLGFDFLLYPFVIYRLGPVLGGPAMVLLDLVACVVTLRLYDRMGRDWLGIEKIKSFSTYRGSQKLRRLMSYFLNRSKLIAFVLLSIKFDAFVTTIYFRTGAFNGLSRSDWVVLVTSLIVSNAYWTFACYMGISVVETLSLLSSRP